MTTRKRVELFLDGAWVDITSYVQWRGGNFLSVTRGRANEQASFSPSTCSFILNNRDGRFSERNRLGAYYGLLKRNTKMRFLSDWDRDTFTRANGNLNVTTTEDKLASWTGTSWTIVSNMAARTLTSGNSSFAYTSTVWRDVTVTTKVRATGVGTAVSMGLTLGLSQPLVTSQDHCHVYLDTTSDVLRIDRASTNPSYSLNLFAADSTEAFLANTFYWVKASVSNGHIVAKYWIDGSDEPEEWQASYCYNNAGDGSVGGTDKDAVDYTPGSVGLYCANSSGVSVTFNWDELIIEEHAFTGEVPSWASRWDGTGRDVFIPVTASGIGRRLSVAPQPLQSAIRGEMVGGVNLSRPTSKLVSSYWPMEDVGSSAIYASAMPNGKALEGRGTITNAGYSDIPGSAAIALCGVGAIFWGDVDNSIVDTNGELSAAFVTEVPAGGFTNGKILIQLEVTGATDSIATWRLVYNTGGLLNLIGATKSGVTVIQTTAFAYTINGRKCSIGFNLRDNGSGGCVWTVGVSKISTDDLSIEYTDGTNTFASTGCGRATKIIVSRAGALDTAPLGHVSVGKFDVGENYISGLLSNSLIAYNGEAATTRIARLAAQYGIPVRSSAWTDDPTLSLGLATALSTPMGPQAAGGTVFGEMLACEATDHGLIYEPKDGVEIGYASRQMLYNRRIGLTLDYQDADFSPPLEPADDDQGFSNSVTIVRSNGTSAVVEIEPNRLNGRLSVEPAPNGVGRYPIAPSVNLGDDDHVVRQAGWIVHHASWDEQRYPTIRLELARTAHSSATRQSEIRDLDIGKSFIFDGMPDWEPQLPATVMVFGYNLNVSNDLFGYSLNVAPGLPYRVGIWNNDNDKKHTDENGSRWDSRTSTLDSVFDAGTDTSMSVAFETRRWVTTASESGSFPFDIIIEGVRLTVTAISGTTSPQTFTITQTPVNGVVATLPTGAQVHVYKPARWAY